MKTRLNFVIELRETSDVETYDCRIRVKSPDLAAEPVELSEELVFNSHEGFVEELRRSELIQSAVDHLLLQVDRLA